MEITKAAEDIKRKTEKVLELLKKLMVHFLQQCLVEKDKMVNFMIYVIQ